ncbi:MAG: hypothetical protein DIJKHBIC_00908 [Thermoanaerobaculia bacterium]|nr:hypothetical protein [Thermoanaerobaculia bacterium]
MPDRTRRRLKILFFSHYFPPEVNAPASRTFENCREWIALGHDVHVVTCVPSHPAGKPFPGYRPGWYQHEIVAGIHVHRVWTYLAANQGAVKRTLNYLSYIPSAVFRAIRLGEFDILIATSPQFFCAVAGWLAAGVLRIPWVFELRDIWPESISAVGAMKRSVIFRILEALELKLYRSASAVACLTRAFMDDLAGRGVPREKLHFLPNGIEPEAWEVDPAGYRERYGLTASDFVCAYVGTIGMAHGLGTVLDVARSLAADRPEVKFLLVGDGADRARLAHLAAREGLSNVTFTGLVPRDTARGLLAASDVALVLLKRSPAFEKVIPSKMLEAFAAGKPVILGVSGQAQNILEASGGGVAIEPENADELRRAVLHLVNDAEIRRILGSKARQYARSNFDRRRWALVYARLLLTLRNADGMP